MVYEVKDLSFIREKQKEIEIQKIDTLIVKDLMEEIIDVDARGQKSIETSFQLGTRVREIFSKKGYTLKAKGLLTVISW